MIYCVRCVNISEAHRLAGDYAEKLKPHISEVRRYRAYPLIKLNDGSELHFVTDGFYPKWCIGMTYKLIWRGRISDETYRSGHLFKSSD